MDSILDLYQRAPPIARTFTAVTVIFSFGVILGLIPGDRFTFEPYLIWKLPPHVWRFFTAFMVTDAGMSFIFQSYHTYIYMSQLEEANPRFHRKEDLIWYLFFVGGTILCFASTTITVPGNEEDYPCIADRPIIRKSGLVWDVGMVGCLMDGSLDSPFFRVGLNYILGLGFVFFIDALIIAMCYTVTQEQRGMKTKFFFFITVPCQLLPHCFIAFNLIFPGGAYRMLLQLEGLVAAHLFDYLTKIWPQYGGNGKSLLPTPPLVTKIVSVVGRAMSAIPVRGVIHTPDGPVGGSSGPLPDAWRTRGRGHRLG